ETGAVGPHNLDPASGRRIRTGDTPDRIVDPHRPRSVDDRLFQRENATDQRVRALVEERIARARAGIAPGEPPPQRHRGRGEYGEHQKLRLPGRMDHERYEAN